MWNGGDCLYTTDFFYLNTQLFWQSWDFLEFGSDFLLKNCSCPSGNTWKDLWCIWNWGVFNTAQDAQNQQQAVTSLLREHTIKYELIAILNYFQVVHQLVHLFLEDWDYNLAVA